MENECHDEYMDTFGSCIKIGDCKKCVEELDRNLKRGNEVGKIARASPPEAFVAASLSRRTRNNKMHPRVQAPRAAAVLVDCGNLALGVVGRRDIEPSVRPSLAICTCLSVHSGYGSTFQSQSYPIVLMAMASLLFPQPPTKTRVQNPLSHIVS